MPGPEKLRMSLLKNATGTPDGLGKPAGVPPDAGERIPEPEVAIRPATRGLQLLKVVSQVTLSQAIRCLPSTASTSPALPGDNESSCRGGLSGRHKRSLSAAYTGHAEVGELIQIRSLWNGSG